MSVQVQGSGATVAEVNAAKQLTVTESIRTFAGLFMANSGLLSVQASAQVAPAGLLWLTNPVGNSKSLLVRRLEFTSMSAAAAAAITSLQVERITFTGVASGAQVAPIKTDSSLANPSGLLLTANTGLTITTLNAAYRTFAMAVITAAGVAMQTNDVWMPTLEQDMIVLTPGEGLAFRQPDAGVAADPRRWLVDVGWGEY